MNGYIPTQAILHKTHQKKSDLYSSKLALAQHHFKYERKKRAHQIYVNLMSFYIRTMSRSQWSFLPPSTVHHVIKYIYLKKIICTYFYPKDNLKGSRCLRIY